MSICTRCGAQSCDCPEMRGTVYERHPVAPEPEGEPQQGDDLEFRGKLRSIILHAIAAYPELGLAESADRATELVETLVRDGVAQAVERAVAAHTDEPLYEMAKEGMAQLNEDARRWRWTLAERARRQAR